MSRICIVSPPLWSSNTQGCVWGFGVFFFSFFILSINDLWMAAGNEKELNSVVEELEDVSKRYYTFNEVPGGERT